MFPKVHDSKQHYLSRQFVIKSTHLISAVFKVIACFKFTTRPAVLCMKMDLGTVVWLLVYSLWTA